MGSANAQTIANELDATIGSRARLKTLALTPKPFTIIHTIQFSTSNSSNRMKLPTLPVMNFWHFKIVVEAIKITASGNIRPSLYDTDTCIEIFSPEEKNNLEDTARCHLPRFSLIIAIPIK